MVSKVENARRDVLSIEEDIRRAETMPARFYRDPAWLDAARDRIFMRSWHFVGDADQLKTPGQVVPVTLMKGLIDEPLILTRDSNDAIHCLSNVCTHRGNLLVEGECHSNLLRCRYHGRCFALDGRYVSAPGFEEAENFPSKQDDLARVSFGRWGKLLFAAIDPALSLDELLGDMQARLSWLPLREFVLEPAQSRDYLVRANWALYCDNYLEGFHIPYVHPGLAAALDPRAYRTEVFSYSNLQVGIASDGEDAFELPPSSPDYGQRIYAYYFWLFPNMMFNFYPWGLSMNVVTPLAPDRTRISYITYIWQQKKFDQGAGAALDRVEREDEDIVERVQQGVKSHFYDRGRYAPLREQGVHHFHRLLDRFLSM